MRRELLESRDPHTTQRAPEARSADPRHALLLGLQRSAGNAAVTRLLRNEMPPLAPLPDVVHIVAKGERIKDIADNYGVTADDLVALNADKLKRWDTTIGFNAGDEIKIPHTPLDEVQFAPLQEQGSWLEWAWDVWQSWFGDRGLPVPEPEAERPTVPEPQPKNPAFATPADVIAHHNAIGTFGQAVTVNSPKRTPQRQLEILQGYCHKHEAELDAYAAATDWLTGSLDWAAFDSAGLADESAYIPFFFALYYAGGGPNTKSEDRTLPLVASPVQTTWTDVKGKVREANASPHISGRAMDVDAADLDKLDYDLKHNIPEFAADGQFPINSTQPEKVEGQTAVHINFKRPVF